ncbi:MAG: TatD family hydrolase [Chloroflexi bacterium]|nr:TatD family hydrolase [Chloroflexota bacterium]
MTPLLADAHTHLDQFAPEEAPAILQRARDAGVGLLIVAGVHEESSHKAIALAEAHEGVYAGVGIHPEEAKGPLTGDDYLRLKALAQSSPRVVCISEVGLDFAPNMPPIDVQEQVLRQEVRLARELGLPVIFHSREYPGRLSDHEEVLRVLSEEGVHEVGGAWHYFQWDEALAQKCFNLGLSVSISKTLLRLPALQDVVRYLPLERLLLETDSFPQPFKRHRSRWTEPKDVRLVAEKVAELKGVSVETVARATTDNLLRLLRGKVALPTRT